MRSYLEFRGSRPVKVYQTVVSYQKYLTAAKEEIHRRFGDVKIPDELEEDLQYADFCGNALNKDGPASFSDEAAEFMKRAYMHVLKETGNSITVKKAKGATDDMLEPFLEKQREIEKDLTMGAFSRIKTRPPYSIPTPIAHSALEKEFDVFISHASEDKDAIAGPLAEALTQHGLTVWYDKMQLTVGDSLRRSIDLGLARSRFGIVILSANFFLKHWPQQELNGLAAKEVSGQKVILPVWHGINREEIARESPILADRLGVKTSDGLPQVVESLLAAINAAQDDRI